ncbi:MAG: peptide deformylase [Oscillospiraceae bacterium]
MNMGLRTILLNGDETLRKHCRPVTDFKQRTHELMTDLAETMVAANGLGLAAPQVGILRRAVVIVRGEDIVELINPEIIERSEDEVGMYEGCLSCPNEHGRVMRPVRVVVRAQDRDGKQFELECLDMAARAACHEIDHLDGKLFIDIAERVYSDDELDEILSEEGEE